MIEIGKKQKLTVVKEVEFGIYLGDEKEKVLLPGKQVSVEIMETVLDGAQRCRFAVTVESEK